MLAVFARIEPALGGIRNVSRLAAIEVNDEGYRGILGICKGAKEAKAGRSGFLRHLKERGLRGVRLIISDACIRLSESAAEFFPDAARQRCAPRCEVLRRSPKRFLSAHTEWSSRQALAIFCPDAPTRAHALRVSMISLACFASAL